MIRIGLIDYYLDEWHARNYPKWIDEIGKGAFQVGSAYGDIDGTVYGKRSNEMFCESLGIKLEDTIEAVISNNDCLIVLSPDNPEEHPRLASLALCAGKPLYVDKTFANSEHEARSMFALAQQHGTPMFSASALRYSAAYKNLSQRGIRSIVSRGGGQPYNYVIHQLEPIVMLMGDSVSRVMAWGPNENISFLLAFDSGRTAVIHQNANLAFSMDVSLSEGDLISVSADDDFFSAMIHSMLEFFRQALVSEVNPPVPSPETISIMGIREKLLYSLEHKGSWINL